MNKNILIITDDVNVLSGLEAKLSVKGFRVVKDNGQDLLYTPINKIHDTKPVFIILDLILPKIDGLELLRTIKSTPEIRDIPVFIFSHLSNDDINTRSSNLGSEYYFIKNEVNLDDLLNKIFSILKNKTKFA